MIYGVLLAINIVILKKWTAYAVILQVDTKLALVHIKNLELRGI